MKFYEPSPTEITPATKGITLDGTSLNADGLGPTNGGTIQINGGHKFTSQQSTISATDNFGNGGTIEVNAESVVLKDTQLNTSISGPQTGGGNGGHIAIDAKHMTLKDTNLLSTAIEGQGGSIAITSKTLKRNSGSILDGSSSLALMGL